MVINNEYQEMLEQDKKLDEEIDAMVSSEEYKAYMRFMSENFFAWSEDFFTLNLYEMGTASQFVDEHYVEKNAEAQFYRFMMRLCFDALP
jgi:hypothetical protein